ncbi:(d)CMP kinase [soil metagenome]
MITVAIDGPAGSGKSTVARALARRLGAPHVDTGAFYRAATLAVLRAGVDVHDGDACARVARAARVERRGDRTLLDDDDVEDEIRGRRVTAAVSAVSAHPGVRAALLDRQRAQAVAGGVVEGRDAGTVVVPDAELKVWLTAGTAERARRRAAQAGVADRDGVAAQVADLQARDRRDAARMRRADDAVVVDTSGRPVEAVVDELTGLVRRAGSAGGRP